VKITFIGGGNMAAAMIGGLLEKGYAAREFAAVEISAQARERLAARYAVRVYDRAGPEALACDVLVLAVKPQDMRRALEPLRGRLAQQLVVSIAAGLRLGDISRWLGGHAALVRAMPNTPALIGAGIAGLYAAPEVGAEGRARAEAVLAAVGATVWVEDEALLDPVTALSGSGPAYVFYFIEALEQAGVALGLAAADARKLAIQTVLGAARLAASSDDPPAVLRERVTSKGGTTEAALKVFAAEAVAARIGKAIEAASRRGTELGAQLGSDPGGKD
jgi:pyrroline-5-carboxylate reductase